MKKLLVLTCAIVALLTGGCSTTGKLIATSTTTVDHAMQAWAVYVVDNQSTLEQENKVRELKAKYDLAEDVVLDAYGESVKTGNKTTLQIAKNALATAQRNLVAAVELFTNKKVRS